MHRPLALLTLALSLICISACAPQKPEKLSMVGIDTTNDTFVYDMADRVTYFADVDNSAASVERLSALPLQWRYIEPLITYHKEVSYLGHHQYFWKTKGKYRQLVHDGLKLFKAKEHLAVYEEALKAYNPDDYERDNLDYEDDQRGFTSGRFNKANEQFRALTTSLPSHMATTIRNNPDKYK